MKLEFTTTACNRPELLYETYKSFSQNLTGIDFDDCTVHINVDPMPNAEGREEAVGVADHFFGTVNARLPDEASFPEAVRWTWSQVKGRYWFNLEDDWEVVEEVDVPRLIHMLESTSNPPAFQIVLRHSRCHGPHWVKNKPELEHIHDPGLPPMIADMERLKPVVENFDLDRNPEKWFRHWYNISDTEAAPYMWPSSPITNDIGREWREIRGLVKSGIEGSGEAGNWDTWKKKQ